MIKTNFITSICKAFPKAQITEPFIDSSYLFDSNGALIGHFSYRGEIFFLYEGYQFFAEAKQTLNKHNVHYEVREPDTAALMYVQSKNEA